MEVNQQDLGRSLPALLFCAWLLSCLQVGRQPQVVAAQERGLCVGRPGTGVAGRRGCGLGTEHHPQRPRTRGRGEWGTS